MIRRPPRPTPFPYATLFRSRREAPRRRRKEPPRRDRLGPALHANLGQELRRGTVGAPRPPRPPTGPLPPHRRGVVRLDRKSTRLNSSHANISYAVFCLKKK